MAETYGPKLKWQTGAMRLQDKYLNFALIRSPIDDVTDAMGGILRACENGATVTEGDRTPPILHATQASGRMSHRKGVLISRPAGADVVLVEFNYLHQIGWALSQILQDTDVITFRSNWENKSRWYNELAVYRSGLRIRLVDADRGMRKAGVSFIADGPVQPFETPASYSARSVGKRLTRALLLTYARRCWLDVDCALIGRDLEATTYIAGVDALGEASNAGARTARFHDAYRRAMALGIGSGETPLDEIASQQSFEDEVEAVQLFFVRFHAAMERAMPDPTKLERAYAKWMGAPDRPETFQPTIPLGWITDNIDRSVDSEIAADFDAEYALWHSANDWDFRITQTVVDQIDGASQNLAQMDRVVPRAVAGVKAGTFDNIEQAMRHEYGKMFRQIGIRFEQEGTILPRDAARRSAAGQMAAMNRDWVSDVNSDVTRDMTLLPQVRIPLERD